MPENLSVGHGNQHQPDEVQIPEDLAILPSKDSIIYPYMVLPLNIGEPNIAKLIDEAVVGQKMIAFVATRHPEVETPGPADIYDVGTAANVARMLKLPDGSVQVLLQGVARVRLTQIVQTEPFLRGLVEKIPDQIAETVEVEALMRNVNAQFQKVVQLSPNLPNELAIAAMNMPQPGRLADFIAANININLAEKQELLEIADVAQRLARVTRFINREIEILELGSQIQEQIKEEMNKTQREYYLREQLKAIQRELGESDERTEELNELRRRIQEAQMPEEALKEAHKELDRLSKMPPAAAEYTVARTYLDWLIGLPWQKSTEDRLDIHEAQQILDEDHHDLARVKDRILDYLAVRKLRNTTKGPILCFVGPPGVGKTSLGQSIARAMGRTFIRMSLGGVRDEADIRGHRRTYIGAMPGRIIQGINRAAVNNPVFMLDEVDKLGTDFRGDPSSALLEVLDPAQNHAFVDHYIAVPFDLSNAMFIATANILDTIPPALRDRMEIISISGYTEEDKLSIARHYLIRRQREENGLTPEQIEVPDETLRAIIRGYTREAGVRNLEREIGTVCRKVARKITQGAEGKTVVLPDDLHGLLGPARFRYDVAEQANEVGVVTGLAWTETGGDVLFVEASAVPGRGNLTLTGQLGNVMQESARAGLTYARSRAEVLGLPADFWERCDIHVHVPAGAIPKDGPSAGITMATAIISALARRRVNKDVAMTGEVTLRGKVLPIGGLKEKVLAAHRAGVKTVILPRENEKDLEEVPEAVKTELRFVPVEHMDQVLQIALEPAPVQETQPEPAAPGPMLAGSATASGPDGGAATVNVEGQDRATA